MPARGGKENPRKRDKDDIACIGGMVSEHGNKSYDRGQQCLGRASDSAGHSRGEEARSLCYAGTEHHHQDISQRMKMRKSFGHLGPKPLYVLGGEQADRCDFKRFSRLLVNRGGMER